MAIEANSGFIGNIGPGSGNINDVNEKASDSPCQAGHYPEPFERFFAGSRHARLLRAEAEMIAWGKIMIVRCNFSFVCLKLHHLRSICQEFFLTFKGKF
jgi:hypothetical protein